MSAWFDTWFESPWYMRLYQHRSAEEAEHAVELVKSVGGIEPGSKILDLACGYGRHAYALAESGFEVVGVDNSKALIQRAKDTYFHPNIEYLVGDMRDVLPGGPFDAVVSFFTSFGYFDDQEQNVDVLRSVYRALKPGGIFILDFFNSTLVRKDLIEETFSRLGGATVLQERSIQEPFVVKDITINDPCSHELVFREKVRLYTREELTRMAESASFEVQRVLGSYLADPFIEESSQRCILVAQKPV